MHSWHGASTDNPRKHFMEAHMGDWVRGCDEQGIKITAKAAIERVAEFRLTMTGDSLPVPLEPSKNIPFSAEAFKSALID